MIYTITFNPAIDYHVRLDKLDMGKVNRCDCEHIYYGGKGLNVSVVLTELGIDNTAIAFVAGFTGKAIENGMRMQRVKTDFIYLKQGLTRINYKIRTDTDTDINSAGPAIDGSALEQLQVKLDTLKSGDMLIFAGSVPQISDNNYNNYTIYEKIMCRLQNKDIVFVVDAAGDLLKNTFKYHPFLIKPNDSELGALFGRTLETEDEIIECALELQKQGARNVLVSRGGKGAMLLCENGELYKSNGINGDVVDSVGAGDSMVAGFIYGYLKNKSYKQALYAGCAAGSATAFTNGLANKEQILTLIDKI